MIIYECKNAPLYSMTPGLVFLKLTLREILWLAVFMDKLSTSDMLKLSEIFTLVYATKLPGWSFRMQHTQPLLTSALSKLAQSDIRSSQFKNRLMSE